MGGDTPKEEEGSISYTEYVLSDDTWRQFFQDVLTYYWGDSKTNNDALEKVRVNKNVDNSSELSIAVLDQNESYAMQKSAVEDSNRSIDAAMKSFLEHKPTENASQAEIESFKN